MSPSWSGYFPTGWTAQDAALEPLAARRTFEQALTLSLDCAREHALLRQPQQAPHPWLVRPRPAASQEDVRRAQAMLDVHAPAQSSLDLDGRLDVLAVAPMVKDRGLPAHPGQGAIVNALFAHLMPGSSVDLGHNALGLRELALVDFSALKLPYALNLRGNSLAAPTWAQLSSLQPHCLRHFHCRSGLVADQDNIDGLTEFLARQRHLETLELGFEGPRSPQGDPAASPCFDALLAVAMPGLRAFYLGLPRAHTEAIAPWNMANVPKLERLALALDWSGSQHPYRRTPSVGLHAFAPEVPPSLHLIWFANNPPQRTKSLLRKQFNRNKLPHHAFEDAAHLRWTGHFDRFSYLPQNESFWSLQRLPLGQRAGTLSPAYRSSPLHSPVSAQKRPQR